MKIRFVLPIAARTSRLRTALLCALISMASTVPCGALILDADDGSGNQSAPPEDPGWANVGQRLGGPSVVYLGHGWVLTANHVGAGIVLFEGEQYNPIKGSLTRLFNDDGSATDLLLFRIEDPPDLSPLRIAARSPALGDEVILIGTGYSRGQSLTIDSRGRGLLDGWAWDPQRAKRWGTNTIGVVPRFVDHDQTRTASISTVFERIDAPNGTQQEAQAAEGDSGGALFARARPFDRDAPYELAGVLYSVSQYDQQPARTSFYGNTTHAADLSRYRDDILRLVPELDRSEESSGGATTTPDTSQIGRTGNRHSASGWLLAVSIGAAGGLAGIVLWWLVGHLRAA